MTSFTLGIYIVLQLAVLPALAAPTLFPAKIVSAKIVNLDSSEIDWGVGDIEVTTSKGKKFVITQDHTCAKPEVSSHGDVGWSVWLDRDPSNIKTRHSGEILRVIRYDGTMADFRPNSRFIEGWSFLEANSAIAITSMGFHGHQFYIEYDLNSGRILDRVDQYKPLSELPAWAQPLYQL